MYKPYHGWRRRYRREKRKKWLMRLVRILLVAEGTVLAVRYIKANTSEAVYERNEVLQERLLEKDVIDGIGYHIGGEYYGIGVEMDRGKLFWFRRTIEPPEQMEEE